MIPRRRIPLAIADLREWILAPWLRGRAADDVARFESAFAERFGVKHAIAVASGRDALGLIVDGLGLRPGDEVIFPAYTLGELVPFLQARGLKLLAADVDPTTYNMTVDSVLKAWNPNVRAIIAVHLLGAPCDIAGLSQLAESRGIPLIEDCAHAAGATVGGRPLGSFGTAALFSLESNKALCAFGGGMLTTRSEAVATYARQQLATRARVEWPAMKKMAIKYLEELGVRSPLYGPLARFLFAGGRAGRFEQAYRRSNDRRRAPVAFSGLQARLAMRRLQAMDERHRRLDALWQQLAAALPDGFLPQQRNVVGVPVFYNFVARFSGDIRLLRQRALDAGLDLGIGSEVMDDCAALLGQADCPGAATVYRQAVLLPLYDGMTRRQLSKVLARLSGIVPPGLAGG